MAVELKAMEGVKKECNSVWGRDELVKTGSQLSDS